MPIERLSKKACFLSFFFFFVERTAHVVLYGIGKNVVYPIASVSLGAERKFCLRHKEWKKREDVEKVEYRLANGSLVVMRGDTQQYWKHAVPKMKKCKEGRINLTFRIC